MTIKELADLLDVSKPTVTKALDKLGIEPKKVSNRFVIDSKDLEKIIKFIVPQDYEKFLEKSKTSVNDNDKTENNDNIENENNKNNAKSDDKNTNTDKETANNENENAKTANSTEQKLIEMLEKALEDKENTIRSQQNTIDNLLKTNTALTARVAMLEDKSQESKEPIIINERPTVTEQAETDKKRHWWQRLFS